MLNKHFNSITLYKPQMYIEYLNIRTNRWNADIKHIVEARFFLQMENYEEK